ncbi:alpha/beta hydrolase [Demequina sp. SO4-13]|uniref:alpha/beta hydrolase n=1 Tax=Demequina sp. SO4-13 TaxID=3401027 RepID=UPI003AF7F08D
MEILTAVRSPGWDDSSRPVKTVALLLHGFGSNEHDLPGLAPWLPPGMPWVSPRAPLAMQGMGYAWFPLSLPEPPGPEHIDEATAALWAWIDADLGPETLVVPVGFSQGGLMATQLLRTRPDRVAATVVLAGFVAGTAQPADALLAERLPPVFWGRGDADEVIPREAVSGAADFLPHHTSLTARVYAGLAHSVDERVMSDVRGFLEQVERSPSDH